MDSGRPSGPKYVSGRFGDDGSGRVGDFGSGRVFAECGGQTHQGNSGGTNWRFRKLDLPVFEGVDPDRWILRAERYFSFYRLSEEEQLEAAVVSLDGDALLWYQWEHGRRPIRRWEELKGMLLHQFRPTAACSLHEQWLNHSQTGDVVEYRRKFIELMAPLLGVPEEIAKGQYITGLREEIRAEVRLLGPRSLDHAMDLSIKVQEKLRNGPNHQIINWRYKEQPDPLPLMQVHLTSHLLKHSPGQLVLLLGHHLCIRILHLLHPLIHLKEIVTCR